MGKSVENDEPPAEIGFLMPYEDVLTAFTFLERYQLLPHGGGWLDQDPRWIHDIRKAIALLGDAMDAERDDEDDSGSSRASPPVKFVNLEDL